MFHVKHRLLADAEPGEDLVQDVLDADRARDAPNGLRRQSQFLGPQRQLAPSGRRRNAFERRWRLAPPQPDGAHA